MEWRTVMIVVLVISLCFFMIPIKVKPDKSVENVKLFEDYIVRYNKSYKNDTQKYNQRFECFQKSLEHIEKMNSLRTSQESAFYGLTQFSDLSEDEFLQYALLSNLPLQDKKHIKRSYHNQYTMDSINRVTRTTDLPSKFDWRDEGVVGPVQDQDVCGACWAFTTIGIVESMYAIKTGILHSLSVQELIDCVLNYGCKNGGDVCNSLLYLTRRNTTIVSENAYPLTWRTDTCKLSEMSTETLKVRVTNYTCDSFVNAESELLRLLVAHGPVGTYVNAISWKNYLGGVIQYNCDDAFYKVNHAVQIVGYDTTARIPHYIAKNSWGSYFGEDGYLRLAIGKNICGKRDECYERTEST